ncbi:uncharacterized protein F5147DRAFT_798369 [Suillus discolor]|uniref:Uncharacterized protein n=1 Tax=Suillus discolor TaxID=1912936 RepID=A0A9P7F8F4_9AGAM|nr:uncharacterized protein F5147DRAFT_798369 [Suillus discolor]KAG2109289.1 hypothetical protein F5147DRAFT_798369 [Suillus discolor]
MSAQLRLAANSSAPALMDRYKVSIDRYPYFRDTIKMSTNTVPSSLDLTLRLFSELYEGRRQSNAYPSHPTAQRRLFQVPESIHHQSSLSETQYHGSVIADEWTPCGDSTLNTLNITRTVEAPFPLDAGSPGFSSPSPMKSDLIRQPLPNTTLDPDNRMDAPDLNWPVYLEGRSFNVETHLEFYNSFSPELSMTPSMDNPFSQTWSPYTLPQSPDTSSSNESSSRDSFPWANNHAQDHHVEPSSSDIQNHAQNSGDVYLSSSCNGTDLHSPTPSRSEERSGYKSLNGTSCRCRWDGGCLSVLTVDRSEVMEHLQLYHGVKSGGVKIRYRAIGTAAGRRCRRRAYRGTSSRFI